MRDEQEGQESRDGSAARWKHPPGDPQAVFREGKDPDSSIGSRG
jgi:hypothetical protein